MLWQPKGYDYVNHHETSTFFFLPLCVKRNSTAKVLALNLHSWQLLITLATKHWWACPFATNMYVSVCQLFNRDMQYCGVNFSNYRWSQQERDFKFAPHGNLESIPYYPWCFGGSVFWRINEDRSLLFKYKRYFKYYFEIYFLSFLSWVVWHISL